MIRIPLETKGRTGISELHEAAIDYFQLARG